MIAMRNMFLILTLLWVFLPAGALAQTDSPAQGSSVQVEMAVWSTQGPPLITANIKGERKTQQARLLESGLYSATFVVPHGRLLPVELRLENGPITEDLIILQEVNHRVSWVLEAGGGFLRSSSPISRESMAVQEALAIGAGALWLLIVGVVLVTGRLERGGKEVDWRLSEPLWLLLWLGLAAAWTWPAALAGSSMVVGRHFDTMGTLWVIGSASRLFSHVDLFSAWPTGADLSRLDSFLLVPVSSVLSDLGAGRIFGWLSIVGVALNAWAAQHFAKAVGARSPWTLLAGVGFGFCGMAATGLLEGHIYQVFNPWLPWFGASLWRATSAEGTQRQAMMALGFFALCWLTTAYVGVVALGLGLAIMISSDRRPRLISVGGIGFMVAYTLWYLHGDAPAREALEGLNPMSAHMAGLLAATPEMDRVEHSMAPVVFGWMLGLALLCWGVLERGRWRVILYVGGTSVVLSMMPGFAASPDMVLVPANLDWVSGPIAGFLRFPIRWAWLWSLCGGVLAAVVATRLAPRWGRWGWVVLLVALAEAFLRVGTPFRQEVRYIASPAQLSPEKGAILELLPVTENRGNNWDRWLANVSCVEQLNHKQPISEDCVHTKPRKMRKQLNVWLQDRLLRDDMAGVEAILADLKFQAVMLKPDLFLEKHSTAMVSALKSIDSSPGLVDEKGVYAVLFAVAGSARSTTDAALQAVRPPAQPSVSRRNWAASMHHGRFNGPAALGSWFVIVLVMGICLRRRCSED